MMASAASLRSNLANTRARARFAKRRQPAQIFGNNGGNARSQSVLDRSSRPRYQSDARIGLVSRLRSGRAENHGGRHLYGRFENDVPGDGNSTGCSASPTPSAKALRP